MYQSAKRRKRKKILVSLPIPKARPEEFSYQFAVTYLMRGLLVSVVPTTWCWTLLCPAIGGEGALSDTAIRPSVPASHRRVACILALTFHEVVWQQMQGVVRFLKTALLQIYCGNFQWKNFENRLLRFDRIMTMSLDIVFWPSRYCVL